MHGGAKTNPIRALVGAWLVLDFFGDARKTGGNSSTLTTTVFSQSFLSLGVAALLYPEIPPVPFTAATLSVVTLLVATGCFDTEQPANRRAADRVLQATSPLGRLPFALARTMHAAFSLLLVTVGMALSPAILLACHEGDPWKVPAYIALACACTALAASSLSVVLRIARRIMGTHGAALVAGTGKAAVLAFGVALFALSLSALSKDASALPMGRIGAEMLPPYHAAKILHDPVGESWRAMPWLCVGALLLLLSVLVSEPENDRSRRVPPRGAMARLDRRLAGAPEDAAITAFCATMLWRSPSVRARVLPLLGVPAAIAFLALRSGDAQSASLFIAMALQFPAIYMPFVIAMARQSDVPDGRWIFDSAPRISLLRTQRAAAIALITRVLLPVHAVLFALLLATTDRPMWIALLCCYSFCVGGAVTRLMTRELDDVPFSRDDPQTALDLGNLTVWALALAGAAALVASAELPLLATATVAAVAAIVYALRPSRDAVLARSAQEPRPAAMPNLRPAAPQAMAIAQSLRRELAALAALYLVLCVLPLLIGLFLGT